MVTSAPYNADLRQLSGVFKHVLAEHGEAFAYVKRLGMRLDAQREPRDGEIEGEGSASGFPCGRERVFRGRERGEMAEGYAALRAIVQPEHLLENDVRPSDLADAMAALDSINPGSPEWGPTFLQVSELVEAHLHDADLAVGGAPEGDERRNFGAS
jgi:hypothetical protein